MIHLRSLSYNPPAERSGFPFEIPVVQGLERLEFASEVTFLVGENGSGKSTLLEAIACAIGSVTVGAESVETDPTLAEVRQFAKHLRLAWSKRTLQGFFMRSEDFFNFAKRISQIRAEMHAEMQRVDEEYADRSQFARDMAKSSYAKELYALQKSYGEGLDAQSHGESYFKLFNARFTGSGVYLLDEPEAPLSPSRQLSLLSMLKMMVDRGGQFIIATHSPILMAYPNATILNCDANGITRTEYEALEHVQITRDFLNNPSAFLTHLMNPD